MKIGLVGPSYQEYSLPFDAQRSINLYPVLDQQGKETASMYSVPGLSSFGTAGQGPGRACFSSQNGRAFVVSGAVLYEVEQDGTTTNRGALLQTSGNVTMAENPTQLAICDGQNLFIFTYATNTFAQVTDPDLPVSSTVTFIDGYFVVTEIDTGRFYISAFNDGTSWNALDFATAESDPDNLVIALNAAGQLWLLGDLSSEIWSNVGSADFPFRRVAGAKLEVGILSPFTALEIDNSIYWLGKDRKGQGIVYKAAGFSPERVSTSPIEQIIQEASDLENCRSFAYQQDGHLFYVLTGGGLETSLVYDLTTKQWHERAQLNAEGIYEQWIARDHMFAFGRHLVIDRRNGSIYEMDTDVYANGDEVLSRERIFTHLSDEDKRLVYNRLVIGVESGVGIQSGQGSDPLISLRLSKDGARTWSDWFSTAIGKAGEYRNKAVFRRLGMAEQMTFNIRITDPVKVAITGAYLT